MSEREYPFGNGSVRLVSADWFQQNRGEPSGIAVIDVQPDVHDYMSEHIEGAVYLNERLLRVPLMGVPAGYAPGRSIEGCLRRIGLRKDVPVVVYTGRGSVKGWGDGLEQTMVAYSLARFGHPSVLVLDGGLEEWKRRGYGVVKRFPETNGSDFGVEADRDLYIEYDELRAVKDRDDTVLLDARPPEVYRGQGPWMKPGHIPGAVNLPWSGPMHPENPRLLGPLEEVAGALERHGATRDRHIVCSCGTGREATVEFILLKWYLGYPDVRIYEGSFTEWSSIPDAPTVTGPEPR